MIARQDDDPFALSAEQTICETDQKLFCLIILPFYFIGEGGIGGTHPVHKVSANYAN